MSSITPPPSIPQSLATIELFHSPDREGFTTIQVGHHRETWAIRSTGFRHYIVGAYYWLNGKAPASEFVTQEVARYEEQAQFDGTEREAFLRVGQHAGAIYVDLCNELWQAVEITCAGWRVVAEPPIRFRRARGMLPLPAPLSGGSIKQLRPFLNVGSVENWILCVEWVVASLRPTGPYPMLILSGEQGTAKTTNARVLRALVDPSSAPVQDRLDQWPGGPARLKGPRFLKT